MGDVVAPKEFPIVEQQSSLLFVKPTIVNESMLLPSETEKDHVAPPQVEVDLVMPAVVPEVEHSGTEAEAPPVENVPAPAMPEVPAVLADEPKPVVVLAKDEAVAPVVEEKPVVLLPAEAVPAPAVVDVIETQPVVEESKPIVDLVPPTSIDENIPQQAPIEPNSIQTEKAVEIPVAASAPVETAVALSPESHTIVEPIADVKVEEPIADVKAEEPTIVADVKAEEPIADVKVEEPTIVAEKVEQPVDAVEKVEQLSEKIIEAPMEDKPIVADMPIENVEIKPAGELEEKKADEPNVEKNVAVLVEGPVGPQSPAAAIAIEEKEPVVDRSPFAALMAALSEAKALAESLVSSDNTDSSMGAIVDPVAPPVESVAE
jgi:LIM domain kinase 1